MGKPIKLITEHSCYQSLGKTDGKRQKTYKALFGQLIPDHELNQIREATNKAWVLGGDEFKKQVEKQSGRRVSPVKRGGDRKSKAYKEA